ncbi:MAG TPA: cysteine desulfurase family protein [Methylomirabilota bacterium]|nr:cysteine desulfurase family protein [Methylomirabilota bacterium]
MPSSPSARIYLDYGGFSPVDPRVVAFMRPFLEGGVGNPAALHSHGLEARASLDGARAKVARLVGGPASGVVFTASATEANNLAVKGVALRARGRHIVASSVEHVSVVNPCRDLEKQGWSVTWLPVDREGLVDPPAAAAALREDTALLSVMAANGEIGALQPVRELGRLARSRGVPFHVDGVGAVGRLPLSVEECAIDLLSLSSNDLCGPPGAGALWVRGDVPLAPILLGGGQESGLRGGTENLPAIVGMGVAADLARNERAAEVARLVPLRDRLLAELLERVDGARLTGPRGPRRLPHHLSVVVPGVKADAVLLELDLRGVAASSGSACQLTTGEPSHVLRAIGCDREEAEGSLCFTLGRWTTAAEIDTLLDVLPGVVTRLRRLAPR